MRGLWYIRLCGFLSKLGIHLPGTIFYIGGSDTLPPPVLRDDILSIEDLKPGMELTGTVRNVIDFGAFVDIGVHQDGLVHISQLSDRFVKHPSAVVKVGDIVQVRVLSVDVPKKRIALTMKKKPQA